MKKQAERFGKLELEHFYKIGLETIKQLETPNGILASSANEIYGCIFGRDSLITALKLLKAYDYNKDSYLLSIAKKVLLGLVKLQGKEVNIESGEEPGRCIHEFRPTKHEYLTKHHNPPWYTYPDGTMKIYDSLDATPLLLICMMKYFERTNDQDLLSSNYENIELAIEWILKFGDKNNDGLIDFQMDPKRKHGGLIAQGWMDSMQYAFFEDHTEPAFPIAPIEVQAYSYLALMLWSRFFKKEKTRMSKLLFDRAQHLKEQFNMQFVLDRKDALIFPFAIDGRGRAMTSKRSNIGHVLWAAEVSQSERKCILDGRFIESLVKSLLQPDIFEPKAGVRTLSMNSRMFDVMSYHNGSIWPHDNSIIAEGMENFGFKEAAMKVRRAVFAAYEYFQTPLELYTAENGKIQECILSNGQGACRQQAWSAATMIADSLALNR